MPRQPQPLRDDLDFYRMVARAAFCNPFGIEFEQLCAQIDPRAVPTLPDRAPILEEAVAARMAKLDADGLATLDDFEAENREVLRTVFLFHAYHRYFQQLDELILEQLRQGDTSVPVSFGKDVLHLLRRRGLPAEEARRVFGIFYQLRRAHHFITRGLLGDSQSMRRFRGRLWDNVFTHDLKHYERSLWNRMEDFSTLLLGETGTGKGAAAAAIGRSAFIPFDERRECFAASFAQTFISLNLSQFPESLIESELFGHRKGAFTGAVDTYEGVFQRCSAHGAIFLDEIGDVSPHIQVKLLRVLEDRSFTPVGSRNAVSFRGRIIAATHRPLAQLRKEGKFRDDFYYRLCSDAIAVPTLRDRFSEEPSELKLMVKHIVAKLAGRETRELADEVAKAITASVPDSYSWPGNVRELEQAIRRIMLTQAYQPDSVGEAVGEAERLAAAIGAGNLDADHLLARYCSLLYARFENLEEVARRTSLDRRTVKRYLSLKSAF